MRREGRGTLDVYERSTIMNSKSSRNRTLCREHKSLALTLYVSHESEASAQSEGCAVLFIGPRTAAP
eukprot:IDg17706t1